MTKQTSKPDFDTSVNNAEASIAAINSLYRESIGLINSLRQQSKKYMDYISDVDRGLNDDHASPNEETAHINALSNLIEDFNLKIAEQIQTFNELIEEIIYNYNEATDYYNSEKGQLTKLLEGRKKLMFLNAVVKKIKLKVLSLQQMNNILFAFIEHMENERIVYKHNLATLSTQMARASDLSFELIRNIEQLN